jgi:tetratricopeptide (TPR) repeat protein
MASSTKNTTKQRFVENALLVWVDSTVEESDKNSQHTLEQLQRVISHVIFFTQPSDCINFLEGVRMEKAFVIVSSALGQDLVSQIHSMTQVNTIYIFCDDQARHEQWTKEWPKIKGVYTSITSICEALRIVKKQCDQDSMPISFVSMVQSASNPNLNELEPSFMYTQLFKNTLLQMEHDTQSLKDFVIYCRDKYADNPSELQLINKFGHDYRSNSPLWWYTRASFIYQMLNRSLRLLEADIIVNMGFFIHDLHEQIKHLHQEQLGQYHGKPFLLYRGQGFSYRDFEKLQMAQGGLLSFNSFLSTSKERQVSFAFAESIAENNETVGILFVMTIDPSITLTPFANIADESHFKEEEEILFSMHTVFRIHEIKKFDDKQRLFEVQLTLTSDDDEQLRMLTDLFEKELTGGTGWERLGNLLIKVGQLDKAEELYLALLEQPPTENDKAFCNHHLGCIKGCQEDYHEAVRYHERAISIREKIFPTNRADLAASYNNIGVMYEKMGDYSKALSFYEKALSIWEKIFPENHPDLATCYSNIGGVYDSMKEYSKSLSFYEKALSISEKTLPGNHPDLAASYNNIGVTYRKMGEYSKALPFYEKALSIWQKTLPRNHPNLLTSYANLASVYEGTGDYLKALSFSAKALSIDEKTSPANPPDSTTSYNNIEQYLKTLTPLLRQTLDIKEHSLPPTHTDLADVRECIEILKMLDSL